MRIMGGGRLEEVAPLRRTKERRKKSVFSLFFPPSAQFVALFFFFFPQNSQRNDSCVWCKANICIYIYIYI